MFGWLVMQGCCGGDVEGLAGRLHCSGGNIAAVLLGIRCTGFGVLVCSFGRCGSRHEMWCWCFGGGSNFHSELFHVAFGGGR